MKGLYLSLLFIWAINFNSVSQGDSLPNYVRALIDSSNAYRHDQNKSEHFAKDAIDEAKQFNSHIGVAKANVNLADLLVHFHQYSRSIDYYDQAISAYASMNKQAEVAELLRVSGRIYYDFGDYKEAQRRYIKGLSICEELNLNNETKGWLLRYIGSVFKREENYNKALEYYRNAYTVLSKLDDADGMASCLNNIGNVYGEMDQDSLQMVYYKKSLKVAQDNDHLWRASIIMDNIGWEYMERGDYETAMYYNNRVLDYLVTMERPNYVSLSNNMQSRAKLFLLTKDYDQALKAIQDAEAFTMKTEQKRKLELAGVYELYSEIYAELGDYEKAYEYYLKFTDLNDSLNSAETAIEVEHIQLEHEREKQERENTAKKDLENLRYANQKSIVNYLVIGSFVLMIFSGVIFMQKRRLARVNTDLAVSLEKEKELGNLKSRFVSTASHQFRTPLTVIKANMSLLDMHKEAIDKDSRGTFEKLSSRVNEQVQYMTDLMNQVLVLGKINAGNIIPTFESTDIVELSGEICNSINEIQEDGRIAELIVIGDPYPLSIDAGLLNHALSNLLMNAFKYSEGKQGPKLTIQFTEQLVTINVKDQGIGVPEDDLEHLFEPFYRATNAKTISGTGLGTAVAKEYIELIGGTLTVSSRIDEGSEFIISFNTNHQKESQQVVDPIT